MAPRERSPRTLPRRPGAALAFAAAEALLAAGCISDDKSDGATPPPKPPAAKSGATTAAPAEPTCMKKGGIITTDTKLIKSCSPYVLDAGIDVINGATLTIEAGVEVRFRDGDWLEIGATGRPGRLVARGTPEQPIVLTSDDGDITKPYAPGKPPSWFGVWFHSGTLEGTVLTNAIIDQGGGVNAHIKPALSQGCITLTGVKRGALELDNIQARNCLIGAMLLSDSHFKGGTLSFEDSPAGFVVDAESMGSIILPAAYRGVSQNIVTGGGVHDDAEWVPQDVPFVVTGDVNVGGPAEPTLALSPGLELRFAKDVALEVGTSAAGALKAKGTARAPVTLTAASPDAPWRGLTFGPSTGEDSSLDFVELSNTAGEAGVSVLTSPGRVTIRNASFSSNKTDVLVGCNAKPTLSNARYRSPKGLTHKSPCS
jgi:hypothetical protein